MGVRTALGSTLGTTLGTTLRAALGAALHAARGSLLGAICCRIFIVVTCGKAYDKAKCAYDCKQNKKKLLLHIFTSLFPNENHSNCLYYSHIYDYCQGYDMIL